MSCIAVSNNYLAVSKGLHIDYYDNSKHTIFSITPIPTKPGGPEENDVIVDIAISADNKYLASITSSSKQLTIYCLATKDIKTHILPRSASKIRFTANNSQILVADKTGDVLLYDISRDETGTKLLGHLSLLLDILQTPDENYVITSDRDEKIKVSRFPNAYNIESYCLGHKEFVNHLELLPHDQKYLTSSSGDGTIKCWDYLRGKLVYSINAYLDVDDVSLNENFIRTMDEEGVEVTTLPIVHFTITFLSKESSLLAVALHNYNKLLIYTLETQNDQFTHKKEEILVMDKFPTAVQFHEQSLYLYHDEETTVTIYKIVKTDNKISVKFDKKIKMFDSQAIDVEPKQSIEAIKVLYKRKFDNVQEYQLRKKQRLEKN